MKQSKTSECSGRPGRGDESVRRDLRGGDGRHPGAGLEVWAGGQQDRSVTEVAHQKTRELMTAFGRAHGSFSCRTLLGGCDLRTPEGQRQFNERDLHHKICVPCVQTVGDWLAGALEAPSAQGAAGSGR
jgi:hypothetical protein